jgi:hypothetical protein
VQNGGIIILALQEMEQQYVHYGKWGKRNLCNVRIKKKYFGKLKNLIYYYLKNTYKMYILQNKERKWNKCVK